MNKAELKKKWHQEIRRPQIMALRRELWEYKSSKGCAHCLEDHPACLDFHHTNPSTKKDVISKMVSQGAKRKRVFAEVEQCVVMCSNCHRKEHWNYDLVV